MLQIIRYYIYKVKTRYQATKKPWKILVSLSLPYLIFVAKNSVAPDKFKLQSWVNSQRPMTKFIRFKMLWNNSFAFTYTTIRNNTNWSMCTGLVHLTTNRRGKQSIQKKVSTFKANDTNLFLITSSHMYIYIYILYESLKCPLLKKQNVGSKSNYRNQPIQRCMKTVHFFHKKKRGGEKRSYILHLFSFLTLQQFV